MNTSDQPFSDEDIQLAKKVIRITYAAVMALVSLIVYLAGGPDGLNAVSEAVQSSLKAVDPFVLTYRWYNKQLWEMGTLDELTKAGWLGAVLIAIGAVTFYAVIHASHEGKYIEPTQRFFMVVWSVMLSGLVAVPLKWTLIVLVFVLGKAIGFLFWLNGLIVIIIEWRMRYKQGKELIETAQAVRKRFQRKAS